MYAKAVSKLNLFFILFYFTLFTNAFANEVSGQKIVDISLPSKSGKLYLIFHKQGHTVMTPAVYELRPLCKGQKYNHWGILPIVDQDTSCDFDLNSIKVTEKYVTFDVFDSDVEQYNKDSLNDKEYPTLKCLKQPRQVKVLLEEFCK